MDSSHFSAASSLLSKLPLGPFSSKASSSNDVISSPSNIPTSNGFTSSLDSRSTATSSKLASSVQASASSPNSSLTLSAADVSAPPPSLSSSIHTIEGKREREREKRIMPARLQRVSNLLAGSTLEDELSGASFKQEAHILPSQTKFILYSGDNPGFMTYETDIRPHQGSFFATPEIVKSCRSRELIETPDFKQRDDTEMMGKTRSIRSQEDTSDAAYERRHRKPDNVEKKQRRLERERLVRDRQKLKERIDQLKVADARLLAPILNAREQQQKQIEGGDIVQANVTQSQIASPGGVDAAANSRSNAALDSSQTLTKLELLRTELLEEANDTLKRYDLLLAAPVDSSVPLHVSKRKAGDNGQEDLHGETSKPIRSISVSGAFANKNGASKSLYTNQAGKRSASASNVANTSKDEKKKSKGRSSHSPLDVKTKRLSAGASIPVSPQPFKPSDGPVRAENTYANIHARTSGGRFAPKSALAGATGSTSKINTKGKWKAEGKNKPPKKVKSAVRGSKGRVTSGGAATKRSSSSTATAASDVKPKRVKIVLSKRKRANGNDESASSSTSLSSALDTGEDEKKEEEAVIDEMELDTTPQRAARAALTLEEAQALLAKAMEDDDDEDDEEVELEIKRDDA